MNARLARCRYQAKLLRYELEKLEERAAAQRRRAWAAGVLRAALLPEPGAAPLVPALVAFPPRNAAKDARWLERLEADTAAAAGPTPVARRLVELRIRRLEEEAIELAALLAD